MADSYSTVKSGKLKLKGKKDKSLKKHKKHKKREREEDGNEATSEDSLRHGGWWEVDELDAMSGPVSIEVTPMVYIQARDNGLFTLGRQHDIGEGPDPEEILTAVRVGENKVAIKSGFDKYLSVKTDGIVVGRSDAIGTKEQWEPIFQEGKMALQACNSCFMSAETAGKIMCIDKVAEDKHVLIMRSCAKREKKLKDGATAIDIRKNLKDTELHYVKQFQSFQDRRIKVNPEDRSRVKEMQKDGKLHEVLLDRREKMKSDRYCK